MPDAAWLAGTDVAPCEAARGAEAAAAADSARRFLRSAFSSSLVGGRTGLSTGQGLFWKVTLPLMTHLKTWLDVRVSPAEVSRARMTAVRSRSGFTFPECWAAFCWSESRGLTFEVSWRQRQDARPEPQKMYTVPVARAWWPAVGAQLDRGVRPHRACAHLL